MTDKGLVGITLSLLCVWLILENFFGEKHYISKFASRLVGNIYVADDTEEKKE